MESNHVYCSGLVVKPTSLKLPATFDEFKRFLAGEDVALTQPDRPQDPIIVFDIKPT